MLLLRGCALLPGLALSRISAAIYSRGAHGAAYVAAPSHLPPQRLHQVGNPLTVTQMLSILLPPKSATCQSTVQQAFAHPEAQQHVQHVTAIFCADVLVVWDRVMGNFAMQAQLRCCTGAVEPAATCPERGRSAAACAPNSSRHARHALCAVLVHDLVCVQSGSASGCCAPV